MHHDIYTALLPIRNSGNVFTTEDVLRFVSRNWPNITISDLKRALDVLINAGDISQTSTNTYRWN